MKQTKLNWIKEKITRALRITGKSEEEQPRVETKKGHNYYPDGRPVPEGHWPRSKFRNSTRRRKNRMAAKSRKANR